MDSAGRVVLPKPIRDEADLRPGEPLEVRFRDGRIEIEPAPREVQIKRTHDFPVAEPVGSFQALRERIVRKTRGQVRGPRKSR